MSSFLVPISIFCALFFIVARLGHWQRKKNTKYFEEFAKLNGLAVHVEEEDKYRYFPILTGTISSKDFKMYLNGKPGTNYPEIYTTMEITCDNPRRIDFSLSQENTVTGLGNKLGFSDFEIGDKYFDGQFKIEVNENGLPFYFFTENIKNELLLLRSKMFGQFHVKKNTVKYEINSLILNDKILAHLHKVSGVLVDIANRVEEC